MGKYPTSSDDALLAATQVPVVGWLQILTLITLTELWRYENVISKYDSGVKPGDLGWNPNAPVSSARPKWFGPTFSAKYSKEEFDNLRLREIKHARLAMFGFAFMAVQNAITGSTPSLFFLSFEKPEYVTPVGDFIPKNLVSRRAFASLRLRAFPESRDGVLDGPASAHAPSY